MELDDFEQLNSLLTEVEEPEPKIGAPVRITSFTFDRDKLLKRARAYIDKIEGATEGEGMRNKTCYKVSAVLCHDFELTRDEAWTLLNEWNDKKNKPPYPNDDLLQVFDNGEKYAKGPVGKLLIDAPKIKRTPVTEELEVRKEIAKIVNAPLEKYTNEFIRDIIRGKNIEKIILPFEDQMKPYMALELALPQVLNLLGAVYSERDPTIQGSSQNGSLRDARGMPVVVRGAGLLKFRVRDAGCNFYTITIAPSTSGKDVGMFFSSPLIPTILGIKVKSMGSPEGTMDAIIDCGNIIFKQSELRSFLQTGTKKSECMNMLTEKFGVGWFEDSLSQRTGKDNRECNFSYPSLNGAIQPGVFKRIAGKIWVEDGTFGRMLITYLPKIPRAVAKMRDIRLGPLELVNEIKHTYLPVPVGDLVIPEWVVTRCEEAQLDNHDDYEDNVLSSVRRLFPMALPKIAALISGKTLSPSDEDWEIAFNITWWFFKHAIVAIDQAGININPKNAERVELKDTLMLCVKECEKRNIEATITNIRKFKNLRRVASFKECEEGLEELSNDEMLACEHMKHDNNRSYWVFRLV